jgi:hypothetical protein
LNVRRLSSSITVLLELHFAIQPQGCRNVKAGMERNPMAQACSLGAVKSKYLE